MKSNVSIHQQIHSALPNYIKTLRLIAILAAVILWATFSFVVRAQSTSTKQFAPDVLVANLYRQNEKVFQPRSRALLDKYFEKSLADLIWKALLRWESSGDSEIEDFDYVLYNFGAGGDVTVTKPIIGKPSYEGRNAQVNVSYTVSSVGVPKSVRYKETIIFLLAAGETGWKIRDIKYDGGKKSLFQMYSGDSKSTAGPRESNDVRGTPAAQPKSASSQTYTEVSFQEVKNLTGLVKSFPFLKREIDGVISNNKDSTFERTRVYVSDLNQHGRPRLFFIALEGRMECGSHGCSLTGYMDQGRGFMEVLGAIANRPVYISTDHSSLLTCGGRGRGEWRFKNNVFEPTRSEPRLSQKLPPCTAQLE